MSEQNRRPKQGRPKKKLWCALAALALCCLLVLAQRSGLLEQLSELSGVLPALPAQSQPPAEAPETVDLETPSPEEDGGELRVYFLDVGQGDSTLIRFSEAGCDDGYCDTLIDTGEYRYADGLTDTLRSLGVETIESFVISHPHTDHMGCAARIVQRFEIGAVYMPRVQDEIVPTTAAYEALLNAVEKKGLTITDLNQALFLTGEADLPHGLCHGRMSVYAPRFGARWEDLNNWSAVLRLSYGETSFLFTGDAERDCLDVVREDAKEHDWELASTVLKASHHGSNDGNPSKWLKAVDPEYAVISCGAGNDYGHPHREPLERFEELGTHLYRTDLDGTVLAISDGKTLTWETGLPSVRVKGES